MSEELNIISSLKEERVSKFNEWVQECYSREKMIKRIENANAKGYTGIYIQLTNLDSSRSQEYKNYINSKLFIEHLKSVLTEFNVNEEHYTKKRFNIIFGRQYETQEKRIVVDWSDKND